MSGTRHSCGFLCCLNGKQEFHYHHVNNKLTHHSPSIPLVRQVGITNIGGKPIFTQLLAGQLCLPLLGVQTRFLWWLLAPGTASLFPQDKPAHFGEEQPRKDWDWDGGRVSGAAGLQGVHEGLFLFSRLSPCQPAGVVGYTPLEESPRIF